MTSHSLFASRWLVEVEEFSAHLLCHSFCVCSASDCNFILALACVWLQPRHLSPFIQRSTNACHEVSTM